MKEFRAFFKKYGFVVIDNVLTKEETEDTIDEIWNYLESREWAFPRDGIKVEPGHFQLFTTGFS